MLFLAIAVVFIGIALACPRTWRAIELVWLAPFLGFILGGFAWSVAAMLVSQLITLAWFAAFIIAGVVVSEFVFIRGDATSASR